MKTVHRILLAAGLAFCLLASALVPSAEACEPFRGCREGCDCHYLLPDGECEYNVTRNSCQCSNGVNSYDTNFCKVSGDAD